MAQGENRFLRRMLDRLLAAMASGPALSCRPHSSRQRVDLMMLDRLRDVPAAKVLGALLGRPGSVRLVSRVKRPRDLAWALPAAGGPDEEDPALAEWRQAQELLRKLRVIADDARTYEQDTGVYVLSIGYPLLSMMRDAGGQRSGQAGPRRLLAPLALMPVSLTVKGAPVDAVELACRGEGVDLVNPNSALLAWLEQRTGKPRKDIFADDRGEDPWRETCECVHCVCDMLEMPPPPQFAPGTSPGIPPLEPCPHADGLDDVPRIIHAAVLGLFPAPSEGLLRDMREMAAGAELPGAAAAFVRAGESPPKPGQLRTSAAGRAEPPGDERTVLPCDPFQRDAVRTARHSAGLVIHGPPGTGKSQTIANIISDHLARGMRVLMVCDKRTAIEVVASRLQQLGLADLCAVVHDPRRDQRDLYRQVRDQLDNLTQRTTVASAELRLTEADAELQNVREELRQLHAAVMAGGDGRPPVHELIGRWLELLDDPAGDASLEELSSHDVDARADDLRDLFERGLAVGYGDNPWIAAVGADAGAVLARDVSEVRRQLGTMADLAAEADRTADVRIMPFAENADAVEEGARRAAFGEALARLRASVGRDVLARWARADGASARAARAALEPLESITRVIRSSPLDAELAACVAGDTPRHWMVVQQLRQLEAYLAVADTWHAFAHILRRRAAAAVLRQYGLPFDTARVRRLAMFLNGLRLRLVCQKTLADAGDKGFSTGLAADERICRAVEDNLAAARLLDAVAESPESSDLYDRIAGALDDTAVVAGDVIEGLRLSAARARAIVALESSARAAGLFSDAWLAALSRALRCGRSVGRTICALRDRADTIQGVLAIEAGLEKLPRAMRDGVKTLLRAGAGPGAAVRMMRKAALTGEISRRLRDDRSLQAADARRLERLLDRYRAGEHRRGAIVRDVILHRWISRQKQRLLAGTGKRLNSVGTALRQRLLLRGERALRLRQAVHLGQHIEGGDPLFDMCPVWMASPETVAQVFPRRPLFDIVIFDEASQCRLEEALPVLTRAARVVIAGDPQQLPPTRFFETALAASDDEQIETEQQLFEAVQGEVEDLLGAALNLQTDQAYLNVHYRSRCEGLIDFSNLYFYESRLQPIPAHASRRPAESPIRVYRPGGVYVNRTNEAEARQVCAIVRELLARPDPPSIGVACFNVQQRELIVETLDEAADADADFAGRLEAARNRRGANSLEGLFVKNLENVQGDERDHIIISTTYGPDPQGRFYRRFGPLNMPGGGRRLNVLVTRARRQIHLVTSIPESECRDLPRPVAGQTPSGAWLLLAYVRYAEEFERAFRDAAATATGAAAASATAAAASAPAVRVRPTAYPSAFARAMAETLARRCGLEAEVYWGNDGFCIDLALRDPRGNGTPALGVLCDMSRFAAAPDPVEWDAFSDAVHRAAGWRLLRLWTPQFFRDPDAALREMVDAARR